MKLGRAAYEAWIEGEYVGDEWVDLNPRVQGSWERVATAVALAGALRTTCPQCGNESRHKLSCTEQTFELDPPKEK